MYHLVYTSSISENRLEHPKINLHLGGSGTVYNMLMQKLRFSPCIALWRGSSLETLCYQNRFAQMMLLNLAHTPCPNHSILLIFLRILLSHLRPVPLQSRGGVSQGGYPLDYIVEWTLDRRFGPVARKSVKMTLFSLQNHFSFQRRIFSLKIYECDFIKLLNLKSYQRQLPLGAEKGS